MKKSELMEMHRGAIISAIWDAYREIMHYPDRTRCEYQIYLWEDGEIERLFTAVGSNEWLQPKSTEIRTLDYICTVRGDDVWTWLDMSEPEDPTEAERYEADGVEELCAIFDPEPLYDAALEAAKDDEANWDRW